MEERPKDAVDWSFRYYWLPMELSRKGKPIMDSRISLQKDTGNRKEKEMLLEVYDRCGSV